MNHKQKARSQLGMALIEAMVAMAVMAFGMLAVVGVQATLRSNGDLSKQRAEAARIAQARVETWRALETIETAAGKLSYADLVTDGPISQTGLNAVYNVTRSVVVTPGNSPPMKSLLVTVIWKDRKNVDQSVQLSTVIFGISPALAGTLAMPPSGLLLGAGQQQGRNPNIPAGALQLGDGTSAFTPPQAALGTVVWVFNNATGVITTCTRADLTLPLTSVNLINCTGRALLLQGFVNFANPLVLATAAEAVEPQGAPFPVEVAVARTAPSALLIGQGSGCFTSAPVAGVPYVSYFCAVPVNASGDQAGLWSGYSFVTLSDLPVAPPGDLLTCRYTSLRQDTPVPNAKHPRAYTAVNGPLSNQNFLVVRRVTGDARDCPDGPPLPSGTTTYPQPQTSP